MMGDRICGDDDDDESVCRSLFLPKTHCFFHGKSELGDQRFIRLVWGHVDTVEATRVR
jgi:hypothetical protein